MRYLMSNMAGGEYRAVIRYLNLKGKTGKKLHGKLADVDGSSAPSYAQV